ncbi:ShlB/FhaC/HecB family hemolysin secretion/activation protein [Roseisalinus antarcticus]|uniref:Heme/hemopexin transporter protein HuxB n=1 Tax=Roseisalinus antarcticus TaxID=254357 RepID=A0A1Y5SCA5_9RHOB|nr:ShlB/FhaC/HecB family hemolysin secretion/activation protein [Roseisalinus antarcticus]SLN37353.1 Heme/hemopexin transporter protein HuxB precursor [Roseisalinus antarcticus]
MTGLSSRLAALALACALGCPAPAAYAQGLTPSDAARALAELAAGTPSAAPARTAAATPAPRAAPRAPPPFRLRTILFDGPSGYFTDARLQAAVAPYLGRRLTLSRLPVLAEAINSLYRAEDIALAQAVVTGADPARGRVTLGLFEARLGAVRYVTDRISEAYIGFRTGLRPGELADTRRIGDRLERLFLTDGLLADAAFSPGAAPGDTDLTVTFEEPPPSALVLSLDTYGDAASGTSRLVLSYRLNSLTGWNDPLAVDLLVTEGARSATLSYARTVTPDGGRLGLSLSRQRVENITGPDRVSRTRSATVSFEHPLALSVDGTLWASALLDVYSETVETTGITTADQAGSSVTLGLNGTSRPADGALRGAVWNLAGTFGTYEDGVLGGGERAFSTLSGSARLEWLWGEQVYATASAAAQVPLTDDTPSRSQFTVTSPFAVPGYDNGLSAGDGGYWARFQIEPARPLPIDGARLRPYAFAALGEAFDREAGELTGQGLASAFGFGLAGQMGERVQIDLQAVRPVTEVFGQGGDGAWSMQAALSVSF